MAHSSFYFGLIFTISFVFLETKSDDSPVCSAVGGLCSTTNGCCGKSCCENNVCVSRSFACSGDLASHPGFDVCTDHYCPSGQVCYLRDLSCDEYGRNCLKQPECRAGEATKNTVRFITYENSTSRSVISMALLAITALLRVF